MLNSLTTTGLQMKQAQLDIFEQRDGEFLERCRSVARQVCKERGQVSINDVRASVTVPSGLHPSVLGAVFRGKDFQVIGFTEATHPQAHARVVRIYAFAPKGGH